MSLLSVRYLKSIVVIVGVLAVCAPLAAAEDPEGKSYEVEVSIVTSGGTIPVACTCLAFDPNPPACLRSPSGGMFLWAFNESGDGVQATTGVALPAMCGGPRAGFEGIALHGAVDGETIRLEAITEGGSRRVLEGIEIDDCSQACQ